MKKSEFKKLLASRISAEEAEKLRDFDSDLYISDFNRGVCRRIVDEPVTNDAEVDVGIAGELEDSLKSFLSEYMSEHPEAHKWIILACLELAFVEELPMHPQESAHWICKDGEYFCPCMQKDSLICRCCACKEAKQSEKKGGMGCQV